MLPHQLETQLRKKGMSVILIYDLCVFVLFQCLYYSPWLLSFLRAVILATGCVGIVAAMKPFACCPRAETTDKKTRRGKDKQER